MREDPLLKYFNDEQMKQQVRIEDESKNTDTNAVKIHRGRLGLPPAGDFIFWLKTFFALIVAGIIIYSLFR